MNWKGYISELMQGSGKPIDNRDLLLLFAIMYGNTSAYKLYSFFKNESKRIEDSLFEPIAYKNVHKRIHRLHNGGLIKEVKVRGGYEHGARNYKVTSRGLMYLLATIYLPYDLHKIMINYRNDEIFKIFVFPYFEIDTFKNQTPLLVDIFCDYFEGIGKKCLYWLDPGKQETDYTVEAAIEHLYLELRWYIRSFVLKIATMKDEYLGWNSVHGLAFTPNDKIQTYAILAKDKKFMRALEEARRDVEEGYEVLTGLQGKEVT